ncbi:MAG TPA: hypothetical protein PLK08_07185, partial [Phycisphaerae bacterium]|nr:hypothetical protein [Phycisphaerae bacterium]
SQPTPQTATSAKSSLICSNTNLHYNGHELFTMTFKKNLWLKSSIVVAADKIKIRTHCNSIRFAFKQDAQKKFETEIVHMHNLTARNCQ